jgi:hypothetical protein
VAATVTECKPAWVDDIRASYATNQQASQLITKLQSAPDTKQCFTLQDGMLYFRGRIWLSGSVQLQQQIMQAFHSSTLGGHSGFPVTYTRIRRLFAWPKMKAHIKTFVQTCLICQQSKPERVKLPGLLQPLPTPEGAW